jgi:hypothetical protein
MAPVGICLALELGYFKAKRQFFSFPLEEPCPMRYEPEGGTYFQGGMSLKEES